MIGLTTGQVAKEVGINLETLRYYERRGLIAPPPRSESNYRLYAPDTARRIQFIKRAQELGFLLTEVKELLSLRADRRASCRNVREQAVAKIKNVDQKIRSLQAIRKALSRLVDECSGNGPVSECPILESLDSRIMQTRSL